MRLLAVRLEWFRGAAEEISLPLDGKSFVVYGPNGAGKSSLVDGLEYVIKDGRVEHLAFEYSGKNQEFAIPNVAIPDGRKSKVSVSLADKSVAQVEIAKTGKSTKKDTAALETWDYGRTILRQEEVSLFIAKQTKGDKYSTLLPLLGLHELEITAENVRKLGKVFIQEAKLKEHEASLNVAKSAAKGEFGEKSRAEIFKEITALHTAYCGDKAPDSLEETCKKILSVIERRLAEFSADQKLYLALSEIANAKVSSLVEQIRIHDSDIAKLAQPLATQRLEVLDAAQNFIEEAPVEPEVHCPACGRMIAHKDFVEHVTAERKKLEELSALIEKRKAVIAELSSVLRTLRAIVVRKDVADYLMTYSKGKLAVEIELFGKISPEDLRKSCGADDLLKIEKSIYPTIAVAKECAKDAPPDAAELSQHGRKVAAALKLAQSDATAVIIGKINVVSGAFEKLEGAIRDEVRLRSKAVMDEISNDIQEMWAILHPSEPIEDVHLYVPGDADKAIDIALKFYGVEQPSPRLTLSEGYRNSLGLCIFLAMAMRDEASDKPIILDDVVVSFDRGHRGMVVELLKAKFDHRQVVVLTHDRDWYSDLRKLLDPKNWNFGTLLPYQNPTVGIRWSLKKTTFGDSRAFVKIRPDIGANDARKILDVELAPIAERLQLKFPYLRGEKNDRRMAYEFLGKFAADAPACLRRLKDGKPEPDVATVKVWKDALGLLSTYANRGSHTEDVTEQEANKLIDACEASLEAFGCHSCQTALGFAESEKKDWSQCKCSEVRWLYGKS